MYIQMMTTVSIPDDLRKRLKRLAGQFDTTQAEIIQRALDLFERSKDSITDQKNQANTQESQLTSSTNPREIQINQYLDECIAQMNQKYPKLAKNLAILQNSPVDINSVILDKWNLQY
jgi:hypothetical protein